MNGNQIYTKIHEDLTTLKTTVEERWNAHDKSADIGRKQLESQLKAIFAKLDTLTPALEQIRGVKTHLRLLWSFIVVIVTIFGITIGVISG